MKDLTGHVYGKLTVLSLHGTRREASGGSRRLWLCRCECATETVVAGNNLTNGHTTSCGNQRHRYDYHGATNTPIYHAWENMISRCTKEQHPSWKDYGGRGITVCERWFDFREFHRDMVASWREGLTLERVDNNSGYCVGNCKWATRAEQMLNKRSAIPLRLNGVRIDSKRLSCALGFSDKTIQSRLYNGWGLFAAVLCPPMRRGKA